MLNQRYIKTLNVLLRRAEAGRFFFSDGNIHATIAVKRPQTIFGLLFNLLFLNL
ncbi:hypothetical protein KB206_04315 [Microvirga sp. STS02]|nr:hypothetical protein [Microvirga sp. STS02]MBR7207828.1 hypothetical protein [Microvirga sp. STS02]